MAQYNTEYFFFTFLETNQLKELESGNFPENKSGRYVKELKEFKHFCEDDLKLNLDKEQSVLRCTRDPYGQIVYEGIDYAYSYQIASNTKCTFILRYFFKSDYPMHYLTLDQNGRHEIIISGTGGSKLFIGLVKDWLDN